MSEDRTAATTINKDDLIVITGAGGFIGGALTRYFHDQGFTNIRAVDKKHMITLEGCDWSFPGPEFPGQLYADV